MKRKPSIYEKEVAKELKKRRVDFETEYRFSPPRRWRFDFVLKPVKTKIAIEIEGGTFHRSHHTSGKGFAKDCEKYNAAAMDNWLVLRYTPQTIPMLWEDLKKLKII